LSRYLLALVLAATLAGLTAAGAGPLQVTSTPPTIAVTNDFYALSFDVPHGGAIRSFKYREQKEGADRDWIYPTGGGLLEDMVWQQYHPGELQNEPYEYKILQNTPEVFQIELWRALKDQSADLKGVVMRKIVTLRADTPAIHVRMSLENTSDAPRFPGSWIQNRFYCGGNKGLQVAYRPSNLGIRMVYVENDRCYGDEFVRRPSAGWAMTFDRDSGVGLLALVDYNYLKMHYSCITMYTTEWFYDRVLIAPGKSWSTEYTLVPVQNVHNCYYADATAMVTADRQEDTLKWQFRATEQPVASLPVSIKLEKGDRSAVVAEKTVTLTNLTRGNLQSVDFTVPGLGRQALIVTITLGEGAQKKTAEFLYSGDEGVYYAPETASPYRAPLPQKIKPELMGQRGLKLQPHEGVRVLHALGLWSEYNRVEPILRNIAPGVSFRESYYTSGVLGPELTYQPLLAEELLGYDLIVLDNVGANALGDAGQIAVQQYVQAGGKLLLTGGISSLGKSRFQESPLKEALPLEPDGFFDLVRLPQFVPVAGASYELGQVQWLQQPKLVRPGAQTLLTAAGYPLLVSGAYGQGQVVVWLGAPMGDPPAGVTPYWESRGWFREMRGVLKTLLNNSTGGAPRG
jgi:hypothetical protein